MTETPSASLSDTELLASMRESAHEELLFFSNKRKEARERWVVSQFLQCRSLNFIETELNSPHQRSKTDVQFRDANFQVKEILNPGTRRSDEIRANYERLKAATKLEEVNWSSVRLRRPTAHNDLRACFRPGELSCSQTQIPYYQARA
jgi:hypothetical protein